MLGTTIPIDGSGVAGVTLTSVVGTPLIALGVKEEGSGEVGSKRPVPLPSSLGGGAGGGIRLSLSLPSLCRLPSLSPFSLSFPFVLPVVLPLPGVAVPEEEFILVLSISLSR